MYRSSETIGAIAAALAKAQCMLANPERTLSATIPSPFPRESDRNFRYASLAKGLEIVRQSLGQQEIATLQATSIDQTSGQVQLTTLLAHASGEWLSSEWPVCPISETMAPHRMGAALTCARRYALFSLVGIAGEDDLDAPNFPSQTIMHRSHFRDERKHSRTIVPKQPILDKRSSEELREKLLAEIASVTGEEALAKWAHSRLPAKNTLEERDARVVELAYAAALQTTLASAGSESSESPLGAALGPLHSDPTTETKWSKTSNSDGIDRGLGRGLITRSQP